MTGRRGSRPAWRSARQDAQPHLGRSRRELACEPASDGLASTWVRTWCQDRALRSPVTATACRMAEEAVGYGLLFGPERMAVTVQWLDLDRIRLDVTWQGGATADRAADLEPAVALLPDEDADVPAESWGYESHRDEAQQWFILDTRDPGPPVTRLQVAPA